MDKICFSKQKHSISEVIETLNTIKTGQIVRGSVARVIDCCPQPVDPFQCIKKLGGLCAEGAYPTPLGQCKPDQCKPVISVSKLIEFLKYSLILV